MPVSKESPCQVEGCTGRDNCAFLKFVEKKGKINEKPMGSGVVLEETKLTASNEELSKFAGCKQVIFVQDTSDS